MPNDIWLRCKLAAELGEDAHPGSGSGGGGIDALVARDRDGNPVIWASHLEGVLRDAARRLHGREAAAALFGEAGRKRQRSAFTSLYLRRESNSPAGGADCRVWRSAARASFDNRAPQDETLRAIEYVPKGTRFEGSLELPSNDLPALQRLLAEVDAIGHGRASGAGRVTFTITQVPAPANSLGKVKPQLRLLLRNLDPVSITATATPTNIIPTSPYIPGRSLLGAIAEWLLASGKQEAAAAVVSGAISVSDALPLPEKPKTAAFEVSPAPLSLQSEKPAGTPGETPWWALQLPPTVRVDGGLAEKDTGGEKLQLKRPEPDLFVYRAEPKAGWTAFRPATRVRLRNGRSNPDQLEPDLFAIEQIAEQTFFAAELRGTIAEMTALSHALCPVLEGRRWIRIGRGGAPVEVVRADWASPEPAVKTDGSAYLTLVSDLLIRDTKSLCWLRNLDPKAIPDWPAKAQAKPIRQDYTDVHGFNGTSRLWRQPAVAVRHGSVFEVTGDGLSQLAEAAAGGRWLGERIHEGYGRFRLDASLPGVTPPAPKVDSGKPSPDPAVVATATPDDPDDAIARVTHGWLQEHYELAKPATSSSPRPSLSQWLDLVEDLRREDPEALSSRLTPRTAGKASWRDDDARKVLKKIEAIPERAIPERDRFAHARLFVRWLRSETRKRER